MARVFLFSSKGIFSPFIAINAHYPPCFECLTTAHNMSSVYVSL
jgi:hypothetical protein